MTNTPHEWGKFVHVREMSLAPSGRLDRSYPTSHRSHSKNLDEPTFDYLRAASGEMILEIPNLK
jgi:hypothetical protein